jgi:hypothetical protein
LVILPASKVKKLRRRLLVNMAAYSLGGLILFTAIVVAGQRRISFLCSLNSSFKRIAPFAQQFVTNLARNI